MSLHQIKLASRSSCSHDQTLLINQFNELCELVNRSEAIDIEHLSITLDQLRSHIDTLNRILNLYEDDATW